MAGGSLSPSPPCGEERISCACISTVSSSPYRDTRPIYLNYRLKAPGPNTVTEVRVQHGGSAHAPGASGRGGCLLQDRLLGTGRSLGSLRTLANRLSGPEWRGTEFSLQVLVGFLVAALRLCGVVSAPFLFPVRRSAASIRFLEASRSKRRCQDGSGGEAAGPWRRAQCQPLRVTKLRGPRAHAGHLPRRGSRDPANPDGVAHVTRAGRCHGSASELRGTRLTVMVQDLVPRSRAQCAHLPPRAPPMSQCRQLIPPRVRTRV